MNHDLRLAAATRRLCLALALIGSSTLAVGLVTGVDRAWANLLVVSYGLVGLGLGGTLFLAMHHLTGGGWATALRRIPEAMFGLLPLGAVGMALVLLLRPGLYEWTAPAPASELEHLMHGFKATWLSRPFFLARSLAYLLGWWWLSRNVVGSARAMGDRGGPGDARRHGRLSAVFVVIFGVSFSLASFDWIMSFEPAWYSTIFGLYNFAGMFVSVLACITLFAVWLHRRGDFRGVLSGEHLHDLGKLLLGFTTFWAYMWFSQYMLIWYSNLPEEVGYYLLRQSGGWNSLFLLNLGLNWAIPFFVLLPVQAKRSRGVIAKVAVLLLVGRWLDLHLMVMPPVAGSGAAPFSVWEIAALVTVIGTVPMLMVRSLAGHGLLPELDPRFGQSLHYHS